MKVALLTVGDPGRVTGGYLYHRRMAERAAAHRAELGFVSVPDLPLPWALASGLRWLRTSQLASADVVVLDSIAAAAASPWLTRIRVPVVGMLHQPPGGMEARVVPRAVHAAFDRWAYRRADLLMVASDWLAGQLASSKGVARSRLRVVPPGKDIAAGPDVDDEETAARRNALRAGRRIAGLCVANWVPRKGVVELLHALALLPDELVTLHLVGDPAADRAYARRVRERLARPELRGRVIAHGILSPADVERLYRAADAFLLPSFEEPYGTVWGEAMATGLPVVGWRAGNLPYLADHGREALMLPIGDVPALSSAIESLARDPTLRSRLGSAAAARAAQRPTWDESAAMFFSVIREVVRSGHAAGARPTPTRRPIRRL